MKNPFDKLQEPIRRLQKGILICDGCGARIKRTVRKNITRAISEHVCEFELFSYYAFDDPRTLLEQRQASMREKLML